MTSPDQRSGERGRTGGPVVMLLVGVAAAVGTIAAYWTAASHWLLGGLLAVALLAGGIGLVWWARSAMPDETAIGEREAVGSTAEDRAAFIEAYASGEMSVTRRRLLGWSLAALGGTLVAALLSTLRSLGPNPLPILRHTAWQKGSRLVTADGTPIHRNDLGLGGVLTVFPEGHVDDARTQTLLIRVRASQLKLPTSRRSWAPDGLVAYSKICTHAGCPVGLYEQEQHVLLCPCHQSTFDVLRAAAPTSGPAARPLPQLPLAIDGDGFVVAGGDFPTPVGPGFWSEPS